MSQLPGESSGSSAGPTGSSPGESLSTQNFYGGKKCCSFLLKSMMIVMMIQIMK